MKAFVSFLFLFFLGDTILPKEHIIKKFRQMKAICKFLMSKLINNLFNILIKILINFFKNLIVKLNIFQSNKVN